MEFTASSGLANHLANRKTSLAFTSYDSGNLFFVGTRDGGLEVSYRPMGRCMGLAYQNGTLFVAANNSILEFEQDGISRERYDATFVLRRTSLVNDIDLHEIAPTDDAIYFAATKFSCVAKTTKSKSFEPVYRPDFISKLAPEDRCHLNGFALKDGKLSLVSMVGKSDMIEGWRSQRDTGGMVINVETGQKFNGMSMPHSPRWHGDGIWYLDSGRGYIVGPGDIRIFCPGFLRGLTFEGHHAIVTVSKPRDGTVFTGLELEKNIKERGGEAWCAVLFVNLFNGVIDHWFRFDKGTRELFDVTLLPGILCPTAIAPSDPTLANRVSIQQENAHAP